MIGRGNGPPHIGTSEGQLRIVKAFSEGAPVAEFRILNEPGCGFYAQIPGLSFVPSYRLIDVECSGILTPAFDVSQSRYG